MNVYADEALFVVWTRQVGVEIHVIRAKLSDAFAAKQEIGEFFRLPGRIEAV